MMTVFGLILSPTPRQHLEILLYISYYKLISLLALLLLCCSALVILVAVAAGTRQRGTAPPGNQELGLGHTQHTLLPPGHREARGAGDVVMAYLAYSPTTTIYNASTTDMKSVVDACIVSYVSNKFDFH